MITQQNINDARNAYSIDQNNLDACKIDLDAYEKYVKQINEGLWNAQLNPVPLKGPFTVRQALLINVIIPNDFDYPQAFQNTDLWQRADSKLQELTAEYKLLSEIAEKSKATLTTMETTYAEDLARAQQIAANDPAVIAAKENAASAAITTQAEIEKKKIDAANQRQLMYLIFGALFFMVIVIVFASLLRRG